MGWVVNCYTWEADFCMWVGLGWGLVALPSYGLGPGGTVLVEQVVPIALLVTQPTDDL